MCNAPEKTLKTESNSVTSATAQTPQVKNPLLDAIMQEQVENPRTGVPITPETLYKELVSIKTKGDQDNLGVKALKDHHLMKPELYNS